ncbi:CIR protein [Plasmodium chabaudi chabaudi]|uniref:CIR protein n=1 Tax=Plasmodium chabaudi chabaudi TaxID=31271 RepID=A0A4V0K1R6_PLACU|nr:CIR protein [Plasmodium chabaudi chabaudi]VTZ66764.1 CIR protein [Plasmodium chabaudi chabaudi]|eukprot:XP_016652928.1 CIR protein [Plasmodium chabaudi chabaudi]
MFMNLCDAINGIDDLIKAEVKGEEIYIENNRILNANCPVYITEEGGQCIGYIAAVISAFIGMLKTFENSDIDVSENGEFAQYAILWLSYKLKKNKKITDEISDIYGELKKNNNKISEYYNYKEQINNLMNMDFNFISKFYEALQILCDISTQFDDDTTNCENCLGDAKKFVAEYEKLNGNPNNTENSSYRKVLYSLSTEYNNLKNKCSVFQPLSDIKTTQSFVEGSLESSEAISPSSSTASKLIAVLSIFVAMPIFLGIAYKYSLFGFGKRSQKQYLRDKLKKIKKKMKQYI